MDGDEDPTGRTFGHEELLPRVPLPALEDSCRRFLEWCAPLLTPAQMDETRAAVDAFLQGPGPALHAALEKFDTREDVHSWLDEFWPRRYLGRRDRIALNANFTFLFPDTAEDRFRRAAGLIMGALHYKALLDDERIPPVLQRGRPLSMEQNKFLFSTTRIPGAVQDTVRSPYSEAHPGPSTARHILVFARGHLFRMDVLGDDGRPHTLDELEAGLRDVWAAADQPAPPGTSVGLLTTKARAEWARDRRALLDRSPANAAVLDQVEEALFGVCLDDVVPADDREACDDLLHGQSANRWFDKALSFIVMADGTAGLNIEHCGLDGTTVLSLVDTMLSTPVDDHAAGAGARSQGRPATAPLRFDLDDDLRAEVRAAGEAFAAFADATASRTASFTDIGAERIKGLSMSPDAFVQLAYQLAHHRARGFVGTTYESIATRQYRHGRTEAMRVVTPEVVRFVETMADAGADADARRAATRAAATAHVERAKACQAGEAPEQHLWELLLIHERRGTEVGVTEAPALYSSPGWTVLRDDYLSTSSAPSRHVRYFGFGSTSSHCIGVGYVLQPDRFDLYLSTPRAAAGDLDRFVEELDRALHELADLLAGG